MQDFFLRSRYFFSMSDSSTKSITIRLDTELFAALRSSAASNDRSMNAEIGVRLATSLNQDALWPSDSSWPVNKSDRAAVPNPERIQRLRAELGFIDMERSALTSDLAQAPKSAQGLMIRRLAELEQDFSRKEAELRLIDPEYRGG